MSKILMIIVCLLGASTLFAFAEESTIPSTTKIGDHVQLPGADGFLRYNGEHAGVRVYALSADIGSADPSEDFRLYATRENGHQLILSLPMLSHRGYRCNAQGETLSVYVVTSYEEKPEANSKPVMVINLSQLVNAYAEKGGGGKPAAVPQLEPSGNKNPNPESKPRSQ